MGMHILLVMVGVIALAVSAVLIICCVRSSQISKQEEQCELDALVAKRKMGNEEA